MATYARLGSRLELNWLRNRIVELPRANRWQALARAALREDLYNVHRLLTQDVLEFAGADADAGPRSTPGRAQRARRRALHGDALGYQRLARV